MPLSIKGLTLIQKVNIELNLGNKRWLSLLLMSLENGN